jgi:hypothetical protein
LQTIVELRLEIVRLEDAVAAATKECIKDVKNVSVLAVDNDEDGERVRNQGKCYNATPLFSATRRAHGEISFGRNRIM